MRKTIIPFFALFLALEFFLDALKTQGVSKIESPEIGIPSEEIYLSSNILEQGDTLFIRINKNFLEDRAENKEIKNISGKLGSKEIKFFKLSASENWIGITGIDPKRKPGQYDLVVNLGKEKISKKITIAKKEFPLTKLITTLELQRKGYGPITIVKKVVQNNDILNKILLTFSSDVYFDQPFDYPLSEVKSVGDFGNIRQNKYGAVQHLGVDLAASSDTSVYAANSGMVRLAVNLSSSGKTIIIDHGLGIFSLYLHLNEIKAKVGQKVEKGQTIGLSGNTGYSIVPHLHFSIKILGSSVDPLKFVELSKKLVQK